MDKPTKQIRIPMNIVTSLIFIVLSVIALALMEAQIKINPSEAVNGRDFPTLLAWLAILCAVILLVPELKKIIKKEPLEYKVLDLHIELKALTIFGILVGFYLISSLTDLFVLGAVFSTVCFMLYFKCKKPSYYAITIGTTVAIWALFRFALNVRF